MVPASGDEVVLHVQVLVARGLPKPERTCIQLTGFGIKGTLSSLPSLEESSEPSGWMFDAAAVEVDPDEVKEEEVPSPKGKGKGKPPPKGVPSPTAAEPPPAQDLGPPQPHARLARPCKTAEERQRLLDLLCGAPLVVNLVRQAETPVVLGCARFDLKDLIHDAAAVEADGEIKWSPEILEEWRAEAEEAALAVEARAAEEAAAVGASPANGGITPTGGGGVPEGHPRSPSVSSPLEGARASGEEVVAEGGLAVPLGPPMGTLSVRVSIAGPIGRLLCPSDLDDWTVLTVSIEGCFSLPEKLLEVGGPLPQGTSGVHAEHPLSYSLRLLGLRFDGGQLVLPAIEEEPADGGATVGVDPGDEAAAAAEGDANMASCSRSLIQTSVFAGSIGREEFIEGLVRAGFVTAHEDGPKVFEFLDSGVSGSIGLEEFGRLADVGSPATPTQLVALCELLLQRHGQLDDAFAVLDSDDEGALTLDAFRAGLQGLGDTAVSDGEGGEALFLALDSQRAGSLAREDLQALALHRRVAELQGVDNVRQWLVDCFGSEEKAVQQFDEGKSGIVTQEGWSSALQRLGYSSTAEAELAFGVVDPDKEGSVDYAAVEFLLRFDSVALARALPELQAFLEATSGGAGGDAGAAFAVLGGAAVDAEAISSREFVAACTRLGYNLKYDSRAFFAVIANARTGRLGISDLASLWVYNASARCRCLAACRSFLVDTFGSVEIAFSHLFDHRAEHFRHAEEKLPRVRWPQTEVSGYRGRAWLQQFLNTIGDARGRNLVEKGETSIGGSWLYFFAAPKGETEPVDFKSAADSTMARIARWHQAQAFVDLRRLAAPAAEAGPRLEFEALLSQVEPQPRDANEAGDLPVSPFGVARTYVKGTVCLDRPLARLCPRDIAPLPPLPGGEPLIPPPPPEKKPPPTASEELEHEAHRITGKLAAEFARMARERGLCGEGTNRLLGIGVGVGEFLEWLREQDGGAVYRDLSLDLRRAIVRLVRSDEKQAPSCGLTGNEQDALYSGIHDRILKHLVRAVNCDMGVHQSRRDERLWRSPPLKGAHEDTDRNFATIATLDAQQRERDAVVRRLAFEYELCGDIEQASVLWKERLRLQQNTENGPLWYEHARFLMRCGQRQLEAEQSLRFAISLRPADEGPSLEEAAFLAFIMQNYDSPCSVGPAGPSPERFEAACSLLATFADKRPTDRTPLFLLFIAYALEDVGVRAEVAAIAEMRRAAGLRVTEGTSEAETRHAHLAALAVKYLALARQPTPKGFEAGTTLAFRGSDGRPTFMELQALVRKERLARGEITEAPARPSTPPSWHPEPRPALARYEEVHALPSPEDSAALECIDLTLHCGIPSFVRFLIEDAAETFGFLSPATAASERCCLQLVQALMLQSLWGDAAALLEDLFGRCDRIRRAHVLLGECRYRIALDAGGRASAYGDALASFETALTFTDEGTDARSHMGDAVLHLRIASIHFMHAEEAGFADMQALKKAMEHYRRSLLIAPTAEVWRCAGVCTYRMACLGRRRNLFRCKEPPPWDQPRDQEQEKRRQAQFKESTKYFTEANLLDVSRPQIGAWLVICAVEMGQAQVAKQALRQVMRYEERLDAATALALAEVLLRFSDEARAIPGEGGRLVAQGRYAKEAVAVARVALARRDCGDARFILGQAHVLAGSDADALPELQAAIPWFKGDAPCQDEVTAAAAACAQRLRGAAGAAALAAGPVHVAQPPQRSTAQEVEFSERLELAREGGCPPGVADFAGFTSGFEVFDHDLPRVLEAAVEGGVERLVLVGARIGSWGAREILAMLRQAPGPLRNVDVTGCAAVGEVGKELVNNFPYRRGCSLEAAGCGIAEDDVLRLRNRTKEAEMALRRESVDHRRSAALCAAYAERQEALEELAAEECSCADGITPPPPPRPAYDPRRWRDGVEGRARDEFGAYCVANPDGSSIFAERFEMPMQGVVVDKSGQEVHVNREYYSAMDRRRYAMIQEAGYSVHVEGEEEEGELDEAYDAEGEDGPPSRRRGGGGSGEGGMPLPEAFAEAFGDGHSPNLIGFMIWCGIRVSDDEAGISQEELRRQAREWEAYWRDRQLFQTQLSNQAQSLYDSAPRCPGVASGQLIAHFSYLCLGGRLHGEDELRHPEYFGLKLISEAPRRKPRRGNDFHEVLASGKVLIESATGTSFGKDAVSLTLKSSTSEAIEVAVRQGSIFQHVDWQHRQNLVVTIDYLVTVPAGGLATKSLMARCMNLSCACSSGNPMQLTEFYFDEVAALECQAKVWEHFEGCFSGGGE